MPRIANIGKRDHMAPVLASLSWLPIKSRIGLKILLLTSNIIRGQAPSDLEELLGPYNHNRLLSSHNALKVQWVVEHLTIMSSCCETSSLSRYRRLTLSLLLRLDLKPSSLRKLV